MQLSPTEGDFCIDEQGIHAHVQLIKSVPVCGHPDALDLISTWFRSVQCLLYVRKKKIYINILGQTHTIQNEKRTF